MHGNDASCSPAALRRNAQLVGGHASRTIRINDRQQHLQEHTTLLTLSLGGFGTENILEEGNCDKLTSKCMSLWLTIHFFSLSRRFWTPRIPAFLCYPPALGSGKLHITFTYVQLSSLGFWLCSYALRQKWVLFRLITHGRPLRGYHPSGLWCCGRLLRVTNRQTFTSLPAERQWHVGFVWYYWFWIKMLETATRLTSAQNIVQHMLQFSGADGVILHGDIGKEE